MILYVLVFVCFEYLAVGLASPTITRLQIISERCSGSNFITSLLIRSFTFENVFTEKKAPRNKDFTYAGKPEFFKLFYRSLMYVPPYHHKHFPPWFSLGPSSYNAPSYNFNYEDSEDCVFVIIVRNPYSWLQSIHLSPYNLGTVSSNFR